MELLTMLSNAEATKVLVEFLISHYQHVFEPKSVKKKPPSHPPPLPPSLELEEDQNALKAFQETLKLGTIRMAKNKLKEMTQMNDLDHLSQEEHGVNLNEMTTDDLERVITKREKTTPGASKVWEDFFRPPPYREPSPGSKMVSRVVECGILTFLTVFSSMYRAIGGINQRVWR